MTANNNAPQNNGKRSALTPAPAVNVEPKPDAIEHAYRNGFVDGGKEFADNLQHAQETVRGLQRILEELSEKQISTAVIDVIKERRRQVAAEGWTPAHDDEHHFGELSQAAAVYAHPYDIQLVTPRGEYDRGQNAWPWYDMRDVSGGRGDCPVWGFEPSWLKKTDRRRDLVKAASLIIADIERLDRATASEGSADE